MDYISRMVPKQSTLVWLLVGCGAICFLPLGLFLAKLGGNGWSTDPQDWGGLGDYMSGTSGVLVAMVQLIATAYIAYILSQIERTDRHADNVLDLQQRQSERAGVLVDRVNAILEPVLILDSKAPHLVSVYKEATTRLRVFEMAYRSELPIAAQRCFNVLVALLHQGTTRQLGDQETVQLLQAYNDLIGLIRQGRHKT